MTPEEARAYETARLAENSEPIDAAAGGGYGDMPYGEEGETIAQLLSALETAIAALEAAGFTDPQANGRDIEDGITMRSPLGTLIEIVVAP